MYDIIIIGAGIAGLYASYLLNSNKNILLLERNNTIGGRTQMDTFNGVQISTGAYCLRTNTDLLLTELLTNFNLLEPSYTVQHHYSLFKAMDLSNIKQILASKLNDENHLDNTSTFIIDNFGFDFYRQFVLTNGRTDYELEGILDTLIHYGLDDNKGNINIRPVNWTKLTDKLIENIPVRTNISVKYIRDLNTHCEVYIENELLKATQIIIATDLNTVRYLLPKYSIYQQIGTNSFLRLYASFNAKGNNILHKVLRGYTLVKTILQVIVPVKDNIYMIAYADNNNAQSLKDQGDNYPFLEQLISVSLGCADLTGTILETKSYFWDVGTHYYLPAHNRTEFIKQAQHPSKNIFVVGEMVSLKQGWVEGALESVEQILKC